MVDPTKGIGSVGSLISGTRVSEPSAKRSADIKNSSPKDEIKLSAQAINPSQAGEAAEKIRAAVEKDQGLNLGLQPGFDESL